MEVRSHISVFASLSVFLSLDVHAHGGQKSTLGIVPQMPITLFFEILVWGSLIGWAQCPVSSRDALVCVYGVMSLHCHAQTLLELWGSTQVLMTA